LFSEFPDAKMVAFAMGTQGFISRVMAPLIGAHFTYGAVKKAQNQRRDNYRYRDMLAVYEMVNL